MTAFSVPSQSSWGKVFPVTFLMSSTAFWFCELFVDAYQLKVCFLLGKGFKNYTSNPQPLGFRTRSETLGIPTVSTQDCGSDFDVCLFSAFEKLSFYYFLAMYYFIKYFIFHFYMFILGSPYTSG